MGHEECLDCDALIDLHREGRTHCDCGGEWPCLKARKKPRPSCGHPRCAPDECYAYPPEMVNPTEADLAFGKKLVEDGWRSVSTKHRRVARWKTPPPTIQDMIKPEFLDTPFGRHAVRYYHQPSLRLMMPDDQAAEFEDLVECMTLTLPQFRAFKKAGGKFD